MRSMHIGTVLLALVLLWPVSSVAGAPGEVEDSCVDCHRNPDFLVQNKKLYDYFRDWQLSVHAEHDVSCADCHGGDPTASGKKEAHGTEVSSSRENSAVDFRSIPDTCGQCHDEFLDAYHKSNHFEHLVKAKQEQQGPNCVTCHGSMNTTVLDVTTVGAACARCHNEETGNHPDIPDQARVILNKFLSIDRFHRYMSLRLDAEERKAFFGEVDPRIHALAVTWHTFDLDEIEPATRALVDVMKRKRDSLRKPPAATK
jgi:hypothetical protein